MARWKSLLAASQILCLTRVLAGTPTYEECQQGGEFIRNAALTREAGMTRQTFLDRMKEDFVLIQAFPKELRWFVKDAADEAFLLAAAEQVFDHPRPPAHHESEFLSACGARTVVNPEAGGQRDDPGGSGAIER